MTSSALMSPAEIDEYEIQTGTMRPGSRAAIERGERLSKYVEATREKVWVEGHGNWVLVPKEWCKASLKPGHGDGWSIDKAKRRAATAPNPGGRGRPRHSQPSAE